MPKLKEERKIGGGPKNSFMNRIKKESLGSKNTVDDP
jgi:hypothetical protein